MGVENMIRYYINRDIIMVGMNESEYMKYFDCENWDFWI